MDSQGLDFTKTVAWWFYSLIQGPLEKDKLFWGNYMNLDVHNIEFAVYTSDTLMETSEGN